MNPKFILKGMTAIIIILIGLLFSLFLTMRPPLEKPESALYKCLSTGEFFGSVSKALAGLNKSPELISSLIALPEDFNCTEKEYENIFKGVSEIASMEYELSENETDYLYNTLFNFLANETAKEFSNKFIRTNASLFVERFPKQTYSNGVTSCKYYYGEEALKLAGVDAFSSVVSDSFAKTCDYYSSNNTFITNSTLISIIVTATPQNLRGTWLMCNQTPAATSFKEGIVTYCNSSTSTASAIVNNTLIRFSLNKHSLLPYDLMLNFLELLK